MVTQTSLLVGKGSMYGPLSRTPPQHPFHGPFDLVGCCCPIVAGCKGAHIIVQGPKIVGPTGCAPIHYFYGCYLYTSLVKYNLCKIKIVNTFILHVF